MNEIEVHQFNLKDTLECGQTFCWIPEGNGYVNVDIGQVVYVEQEGEVLRWESSADEVDIFTLLGLKDSVIRFLIFWVGMHSSVIIRPAR